MFTISAFPSRREAFENEKTRHHEDVEDELMAEANTYDDFENSERLTSPGNPLTSSDAFMRGHGTYIDGKDVVASVAGTVERVNKLITVRTLRARYTPEVGDLVVGRITEVAARRWKVDAGARQDAVLMLSSVNLPGGIQRRKLESDELQMRTFFEEGDLLVAEVQAFFADGSMSLHTRSLKYGKLRNGQLVIISPVLIRRLKSHFLTLSCGIDVILGLNGFVWVNKHTQVYGGEGEEGFDTEAVYSNRNDDIDDKTRKAIVRVCNIIRVLAVHYIPLSDAVLADAYDWVLEHESEYGERDLLRDDVAEALVITLSANRY